MQLLRGNWTYTHNTGGRQDKDNNGTFRCVLRVFQGVVRGGGLLIIVRRLQHNNIRLTTVGFTSGLGGRGCDVACCLISIRGCRSRTLRGRLLTDNTGVVGISRDRRNCVGKCFRTGGVVSNKGCSVIRSRIVFFDNVVTTTTGHYKMGGVIARSRNAG